CARLPRGDNAAEAALAGAEDDDRLAGLQVGHRDGPAEARADRVEEGGDDGVDGFADGVDTDGGRQVEVLGVATPEAGRVVDAEESVGSDAPAAGAEMCRTARALRAIAARGQRFDADAVAFL